MNSMRRIVLLRYIILIGLYRSMVVVQCSLMTTATAVAMTSSSHGNNNLLRSRAMAIGTAASIQNSPIVANAMMLPNHHLRRTIHHSKDDEDDHDDVPMPFRSIDGNIIDFMNDKRHQPFPRWEKDDSSSMIMDAMIQFVLSSTASYEAIEHADDPLPERELPHTTLFDHKDDMVGWNPEILFVLDIILPHHPSNNDGRIRYELHVSQAARKRLLDNDHKVKKAIALLRDSIEIFIIRFENDPYFVSQQWPHLHQLLSSSSSSNNGIMSIPILFQFCDYTGCNYHNYQMVTDEKENVNVSIPTFTVAANTNCSHTFPFPNYYVYHNAKLFTSGWHEVFDQYRQTYPSYVNKKKQVVWRGSLTGKHIRPKYQEHEYDVRYQILKLVHSNTVTQNDTLRTLYDIKMTHTYRKVDHFINVDILGGIHPDQHMPMDDFQNYRAILDMDGYSWSSRFSELLCYNSVVMKVEPQYVDYFYYQNNNPSMSSSSSSPSKNNGLRLLPWKHYIPIKHDLSDLFEKTMYAMDDNNIPHMEQMIANANEYCSTHLLKHHIQYDALDVVDKYVEVLHDGWQPKWNNVQEQIMNGPLQMMMIASSQS